MTKYSIEIKDLTQIQLRYFQFEIKKLVEELKADNVKVVAAQYGED